jgi:hypothetical protein
MPTNSYDLARTYTSYSGVDIKAVIGGEIVGTLQAISYAVQREKAPIYVMGRVDPLSFSRGKRGIAGTMISLMLDQHLVKHAAFAQQKFIADKDEIYPEPGDIESLNIAGDTLALDDLTTVASPPTNVANNLSDSWQQASAWYVDQILPFDVVIVAANEYGQAATMRVYGIEILNEGSGFSIDDIVIENQMTYVARTILPWQKLGNWNSKGFWEGAGTAAGSGAGTTIP